MSAPPGYRDHDDSAAKALDAAHAQNDALRQENSRLRAVVEKLRTFNAATATAVRFIETGRTDDDESSGTTDPNASTPRLIGDGFGNHWSRCGADRSLHVVRPGKVQCNYEGENCPNKHAARDSDISKEGTGQ